jgi:D-alanyl-D-alanine carboxypeptidase/D-alanyl-D-alanine-endopeptidase (penicillin-binding protein 4)
MRAQGLFASSLLALLFAGCASGDRSSREGGPPPLTSLSIAADAAFKRGIDACLPDSLFPPSNVGIKVVSTATGELRYALNADMLFTPASNEKLVTSATALSLLGPRFPLRTTVSADTVGMTIWITGHGDPLLSAADLDSLARAVAPALRDRGIWRVRTDVSYFDDLPWGSGWTWDGEPAGYAMFISPLIVNNNTVTVRVTPASTPGLPPSVIAIPRSGYFALENRATTIADTPAAAPLRVTRNWREHSNTIIVAGEAVTGRRGTVEELSVWRPELLAATVFAERLASSGVLIAAAPVDTGRAGGIPVGEFAHPLDTVVTFMNKVSDNLSAEALLKVAAAENLSRAGSAEAGALLAGRRLSSWGIDTLALSIADGSGLSRYNLTSPSAIVALLQGMSRDSLLYPTFYHSLPIAGVDGTIGRRMTGTPAQGNLRAKTGSLNAVTALSGYVRTAGGELLTFSILMQNTPGSVRRYRLAQDRIGAFLAGWK